MDSFIDEELNSADENEPVLLDISDLLNLKRQKKKNIKEELNYVQKDFNFLKPVEDNYDDNEFLITEKEKTRLKNKEYCSSKYTNYYLNIGSICKNCYKRTCKKLGNIFTHKRRDENFFSYSNTFSSDCFNILANRLYYSKITSYIYFFVLLLNIFILIYCFFTKILNKFVVCSEIFVIFMLFIEVCLRLITEGSNYFYHFDGLFDVTVTIMCFLLLISSGDLKIFNETSIVKTKNKEIEEIISQSLTVLRFSFQLFRTITLFMHHKRTKAPNDNIDFSLLNLPKDDF
ncbi:conserved Plasmodium protein, unknown function [Plasmodium gallinaceum]|uniref:Ion transport domain-containing protein n=1 Tax=Plasmodium gallinaceum TaxID=5849 RepID=A0A1J1GTG4_PLAGA|nr:conserved Plasmodium protein, unknown function [Plasmodium gallinaceum]CRG95804.1 conserved Plasmodium protein, unknown function [Plasmodium gallinaceum]